MESEKELPPASSFELPNEGLPSDHIDQVLSQYKAYLLAHQSNFLGYQVNQKLDFVNLMSYTLDMHINNIGDAFDEGNLRTNTKPLERAVLNYYARLWNAKPRDDPNDKDAYWGFCLTMGATEGNLYGMWNARDYLSGKKLLLEESPSGELELVYHQLSLPMKTRGQTEKELTPIAFYSEDTHYSLSKAMKMLAISTFTDFGNNKYKGLCPLEGSKGVWPSQVPSNEDGDVDIEALATLVDFFAEKQHPVLVCFNYGTTFKGAYDDVKSCGERLVEILKKHGMYELELTDEGTGEKETRYGFWFHVDGALGASYMPFVEMAHANNVLPYKGPMFDFRLPFVMSISMSGHKWPGSPVPCGIYMSKNKYRIDPPSRPEYTGVDTTFAGSRNGLSVMALWCHLARTSYDDQIDKILKAQALAEYTVEKLHHLEKQLGKNLYVGHTKLSLTIRFYRPNNDIVKKYSLSNETLNNVPYSHVFMMHHVTTELIDRLIIDLSSKGAFEDALDVRALKHEAAIAQRGRGFK